MEEYAILLSYAIQAVRFALTLVGVGSAAHTFLSGLDADLTRMQAEGNRVPTPEERAALIAKLEQLSLKPAQA
jgi:hypothetical protein